MPDVKDAAGNGSAEGGSDALEKAMQEAVEAVEKREGPPSDAPLEVEAGDDSDEDEVEVRLGDDGPAPKKTDASAAVTEALIKAKNELEGVLEQTRNEVTKMRDKWLRSAADLQNYKKRAARERDEVVKFANERMLKDILPVLDDLDRTLEVVAQGGGEADVATLVDGVKLVHKKFLGQLEKHNVTTFESMGEPFDPGQHEAVTQMPSTEAPAGCVAAEVRRGFFLSGRLLRPAMVAVSLGPPTAPEDAKDSEPAGEADAEEPETGQDSGE